MKAATDARADASRGAVSAGEMMILPRSRGAVPVARTVACVMHSINVAATALMWGRRQSECLCSTSMVRNIVGSLLEVGVTTSRRAGSQSR